MTTSNALTALNAVIPVIPVIHPPVHTQRLARNALCAATLFAVLALCLHAPAQALGKAQTAAVQARFQQERSACLNGATGQDRATCLREAAAARAEALNGGLGDGSAPYADNQRQRCTALPASERQACLARMQGQGSVSGSVAGGGLLRELVTTEPAVSASATPGAPPAAAASAVPAASR